MPYWKEEQKYYEEAKLEGKDDKGKKAIGSRPLQLSTEDLRCTYGNRPYPNGTCTDGSLPLVLNRTQTAMTATIVYWPVRSIG